MKVTATGTYEYKVQLISAKVPWYLRWLYRATYKHEERSFNVWVDVPTGEGVFDSKLELPGPVDVLVRGVILGGRVEITAQMVPDGTHVVLYEKKFGIESSRPVEFDLKVGRGNRLRGVLVVE